MYQFLDIAAQVSHESEESEASEELEDVEREYEEAFASKSHEEHLRSLLSAVELVDDRQAEFEQFVDELVYSANQRHSRDRQETEGLGRFVVADTDRYIPGDDPLWRVKCRVGTEEIAVLSLCHTVQRRHCIKSAFAPGGDRGYIYIEGSMSAEGKGLLEKTPGIVVGRSGVRCTLVEPDEYLATLFKQTANTNIRAGDWIRIRKGMYKGDAGIVDKVHGWGATVLLLPRLSTTMDNLNTPKQKRKATFVRPEPGLFDPKLFESLDRVRMCRIDDQTYTMGGLKLEHGILSKEYSFESIQSGVFDIPHKNFVNFQKSTHPRVTCTASVRPQEWSLVPGDEVVDTASGKHGTVENVNVTFVEVNFDKNDTRPVPWKTLRKVFSTGDTVTVTGGALSGLTGWVLSTYQDIATIVTKKDDDVSTEALKEAHLFVNFLKSGYTKSLPDPHDTIQQSEPSKGLRRHPWIGTEVLVCRQGHIHKGQVGEIVEILSPLADNGNSRIVIQTTSYNPHIPFSKFIAEYADVVDNRQLPITTAEINSSKARAEQDETLVYTTPARGQTPMPTDSSSTPAWNPVSTDAEWKSSNTDTETIREPVSNMLPQHALLNPLLAGATVHVVQTVDKSKVFSVALHTDNGVSCMRRIQYHVSVVVPPDSVMPKHPSPTHDNGLLLVIRGEHCGKYVRRLYHNHRHGQSTLIIVRVVKVAKGSQDFLTDEELELEVEYLATVDETSAQKKLNKNLMAEARQKYKNSR